LTKQTAASPHPFGELLAQYRARRPGLSQRHLAELAGYDQAILVRMAQGKKDLTGPSGRERVIRIIETLADQNCLSTVEEANSLLAAAGQPPLYDGQPTEARLLTRLMRASSGHRVRRTNLPAPLAGFVGRAQEIADVRSLINTSRLVTLTGAGGAGKTRLAQRVAADVLLQFTDGVWYAELATLADAALITETVARIFGLSTAGATAFDDLANLLRERHMLLVLDNCEHLIDSAAEFAQRLLSECARLSILATSREALNVEGEMTWRVPPMQQNEAAKLFIERARLVRPQQALREDNATVAHICARLDGMPLALELAAARLNTLSLSDIAGRLDNRFALLTEGRRGALPRHQTLQALIDWSYELLSAQEKIAFRRLGVFMGGWTLQTAIQVVCDDQVDEREVLPTLTQLVRKSLVGVEERAGETRYTFLETIRQYALERLAEHGELDEMRLRHAKAYETLAWETQRMLQSVHGREWYQKTLNDVPNYRQAIQWCFETAGQEGLGCSIVGGLWEYFVMGLDFTEYVRWSRWAMSRMPADLAPHARGCVFLLPGFIDVITAHEAIAHMREALSSFEQTSLVSMTVFTKASLGRMLLKVMPDSEEGTRLIDEAYAMAIDAGDVRMLLPAIAMRGHAAAEKEDFATALSLYREYKRLAQELGDIETFTMGEYFTGETLLQMMELDEAATYLERAYEHHLGRDGDDTVMMEISAHLAFIQFLSGDAKGAMMTARESLARERRHQSITLCKSGMAVLARVCAEAGEIDEARAALNELVDTLQKQVGDTRGWYGGVFDIAACIASVAGGNALRVATLFGAADEEFAHAHLAVVLLQAASLEVFNGHRARYYAHANAPHIAKARAVLGDAAYDAAYAAGRAMTTAQAIAYALGEKGRT
jgi:predicted ATPase